MTMIAQTTTNSKKEAKFLVELLLHKRLIACAQISKCDSAYIWKGKITKSKEFLITLKTTRSNLKQIEKLISSNHSYELSEFVSFPVFMSEKYEKWLKDSVKKA